MPNINQPSCHNKSPNPPPRRIDSRFSASSFFASSFASLPRQAECPLNLRESSPKSITLKNRQTAEVFNIQEAGICGWPTKKKILEVFKVGDKVVAYHFDGTTVLNLFFADEERVRRFQETEKAEGNR